jgi:phosphatidyl-myo-inositol dimannoside synthase
MKLLVVSETHFACDDAGRYHARFGVDAYHYWARYLGPFDEIVVAARAAAAPDAEDFPLADGPGVTVAPLPDYQGWWGALQQREASRLALEAATRSADALCLRAPGPIAGLAWRHRQGKPFAVEVVGDPIDAFAPGAVRSAVRPFARALLARELRGMCQEAAAVSYVTEHALQARYPAGGWSVACSDVRLEDEAFAADNDVRRRIAERARQCSTVPPFSARLLFVGSLSQLYKGQDVLIDAVADCRRRGLPIRLTIAGDGRYRAALEARARRVQAPVEFVGQVPAGAAVRALLDRTDLFVLPSRTEGMPRAMLEAMARGVPCLGSRVGGIPELLPASRLVPPGDSGALRGAIEALCAAPEGLLAPALQDLARARQFHAPLLADRWQSFLDHLAAALPNRALSRAEVAG